MDNDTEDDDAVNSNNSAVNNVDQSILGLYRQTIIEIACNYIKIYFSYAYISYFITRCNRHNILSNHTHIFKN